MAADDDRADSDSADQRGGEAASKPRLVGMVRSFGWFLLVLALSAAAHALLIAGDRNPHKLEPFDEIADRVEYQLGHAISRGEMQEFELGEFHTSVYRSDLDTTLRLEFRLSLIVKQQNAAAFDRMLSRSRHRLRDAALTAVARSATHDLLDPTLRELKAAVAEAANDVCGHPVVVTATFADYSFVDQM